MPLLLGRNSVGRPSFRNSYRLLDQEENRSDETKALDPLQLGPRLSSSFASESLHTDDYVELSEEKKLQLQVDERLHQLPSDYRIGLVYCVIFGLTLGGLFFMQKVAMSSHYSCPFGHLLFFRSVVMTAAAYVNGKRDGVDFSMATFKALPDILKTSLVWRSLFGYVAVLTSMGSIYLAPESVAYSILLASAFSSAAIGQLAAHEQFSMQEVLSLMLCASGVILLTNGELIFNRAPSARLLDISHHPDSQYGMAVSLSFALFSALQMLKTREMGAFLHTGFSTFIQGAMGTILSFIAVLVVGGEWEAIGPSQVVIYLIYGVMAWANQEAMGQALKVVRQGTVASSICLAILAAFMADVMYFDKELLVQDMGGAALVIFFTGLQMHLSSNEIENPCLE